MERLLSKWETAKSILPGPEIVSKNQTLGITTVQQPTLARSA
ncbi:MAG: hypothetical protein Ct9H90mP27_7410 [Gammaproteobacteria bacterium]|nr:MAG: hypothetical protein Ct9H90mP27_7410 [Gammaproteobacteria bacterium]